MKYGKGPLNKIKCKKKKETKIKNRSMTDSHPKLSARGFSSTRKREKNDLWGRGSANQREKASSPCSKPSRAISPSKPIETKNRMTAIVTVKDKREK